MRILLVLLLLSAPLAEARTVRKLKEPAVIDGLPCAERAIYRKDGSFEGCKLGEDLVIQGHAIPKGIFVYHSRHGGYSGTLTKPTMVQGIYCHGSGAGGASIGFHPNGRLRTFYLQKDAEIDGVPCRAGGFWTDVRGVPVHVNLYDDGRLRRCEAARDVTIGDRTYAKGEEICLGRDGMPAPCEPH